MGAVTAVAPDAGTLTRNDPGYFPTHPSSTNAGFTSYETAASAAPALARRGDDDGADVRGRGDGVARRSALPGADGRLAHPRVGGDLVGRGAGHMHRDRADVGRSSHRGRCGREG